MVQWNPKQGLLTHFSYQDGRLLVRKPGLYYVYAKTCFRYYAESELHHTRNTHHHPPRTRTRKPSAASVPPPSSHRHWPPNAAAADDVITQPPSPAQLMQYVLHERPSRGGAPLRPLAVMKGGSTQRWSERGGGYNMYCLQQGRALDLRTGDGLLVRVANAWMLDPEPQASYFGAFRIGH
ncbi:tumor necrosis factor ligand superfamily member 11-like [Engraulis encrasicolus]|uniref:tumor necrosis factor ligand superfamily member 11-like n=1 Tax=Engraulis encrasicolus TaxID=184585 RepID=UPI002FD1A655